MITLLDVHTRQRRRITAADIDDGSDPAHAEAAGLLAAQVLGGDQERRAAALLIDRADRPEVDGVPVAPAPGPERVAACAWAGFLWGLGAFLGGHLHPGDWSAYVSWEPSLSSVGGAPAAALRALPLDAAPAPAAPGGEKTDGR